jgi:hypothetical protein
MKRILSTLLLVTISYLTANAQDLLKHKWHRFYIGGNKGYFVKTTQFTASTMTENQFGSGGAFDNNPMEIKVAEIYTSGNETRVITDYGDSSYYILVFKNFTDYKVQAGMNIEGYKTIDEAKTFTPAESEFSDWFTEAGYKAEEKKPAMPEMTKKDALAFVTFLTNALKEIEKAVEERASENKEMDGFAAAMLMAVMPSKYAASKGYNAYKSLAVIDRGMNKFKNDPDIKKLLKEAGLPDSK